MIFQTRGCFLSDKLVNEFEFSEWSDKPKLSLASAQTHLPILWTLLHCDIFWDILCNLPTILFQYYIGTLSRMASQWKMSPLVVSNTTCVDLKFVNLCRTITKKVIGAREVTLKRWCKFEAILVPALPSIILNALRLKPQHDCVLKLITKILGCLFKW